MICHLVGNDGRNKRIRRIDQLIKWCGEDFDGCILFDECKSKAFTWIRQDCLTFEELVVQSQLTTSYNDMKCWIAKESDILMLGHV